jgi:hypothetical protein
MAYGALTMRSTVMGDTPGSPAILRTLSIRPGLCLSCQKAINHHAVPAPARSPRHSLGVHPLSDSVKAQALGSQRFHAPASRLFALVKPQRLSGPHIGL